ncbi:MAG: type II secretion system secretin GspD [Sphingomonadaceae bacterium]|nr:type II secretion system secretin GspD [Sphingomonadaceae bacterium]
MKNRQKARRWVAALLLPALLVSAPILAQQSINMRDADIRAFIADAARVTGRTFVVDGRVQGRVTVVSERALSRAEYFEVFLSTLRANGLVAIPLPNGNLRIQPAEGLAAQPSRVGGRGASANALITDVVRLSHIDAASAIETLRPLVSAQGSITANRNANSLVVVDFADNVRRIRTLIASIDRDASASRIVHLTNMGAREMAASLGQLTGGASGDGGARVAIAPFDAANSIALTGDATSVERFARLAADLDARAAGAADIRVYWLQHADAARLLPTLQSLVGGGSDPVRPDAALASVRASAGDGGAGAGGGAGVGAAGGAGGAAANTADGGANSIARHGPAIITRYEGANAIIVAANGDVQRQLGELIRQLDVRRRQVLVEALIVEIGDNAARQLGVQFLIGGENVPFAATNYSNANPNIFTIGGAIAGYELSRQTTTINGNVVTTTDSNPLGSALGEAAARQILGATGGFAGFAGDIGRNTVFGAIINAVQNDTASNLLATPHIVTLDNSEARFLVGQEVPISTGEALSDNFDNAFRTISREDVGIKLTVTPQINEGGEIKLYIRQEVSSVAGPVSSRSSELILNKRLFETVMTADNGQIVAIGGLLNDEERRTLERIPLLSDIPLIGELFRSRSRSHARTNLMVFIRPTILDDAADNAAMTARRYQYIRAEQLARNPDAPSELDALVRDYIGTNPPMVQGGAGDVTYPGGAASDAAVPPVEAAPPPPASGG